MEKQYSVQFFTSLVESIQKCCREFLEFDQAIELSGYLNLEIDNFKKERYVLSEMITSMGDVISESYCTKAFKTVQRNPRKSPTIESVLKESSNNFDRNIPSPPSQDISSHIGIRRRFGPQRHYLSPPGRKRNLIQNKRVIPSSFTQASLTKNAQPYEIQARPTMTMTYSTTEESVLSTSEHFSALGNESLVSNYVKDDVTDSDQIKEKTANDLDVLYAAATSVSNLENSEFTPVSSISTNVVQTNAQSSNNSCITESEGSHSETIRLPLSIKEEDNDEDDDIMFIDGPDNGTGNVTVTSCSALNTSGANVESHLNTSFSDGQRREGEENSGSIELKKCVRDQRSVYKNSEDMKSSMQFQQDQERKMQNHDDVTRLDPGFYTSGSSNFKITGHQRVTSDIAGCNDVHGQLTGQTNVSDQTSEGFMTQTQENIMHENLFGTKSSTNVKYVSAGSSVKFNSQRSENCYQCSQCSYRTSYFHNLRRHQRIHSGDFFNCHLCPCHFSDAYRLKKHLKLHFSKLACEFCGKLFVSYDGLAKHKKSHLHK